jgi:beta-glucosidase
VAKNIEEGKVGGLFNIKSVKRLEKYKKVLLKKPSKKFIAFWYGCNPWLRNYTSYSAWISCTWDMN